MQGEIKCQRRKKAVEADVAVDWGAYFESIKGVCPWSWSAWQTGAIEISHWHSQVKELKNYKARLYIAPKHKPRQLKKICSRLNLTRTHEEWLWSHPSFAHNSTPVPVFIQQDRQLLEKARNNLKNNSL